MIKVTRRNSRVPSRTLCLLLVIVLACPLPQKDWATLLHLVYRYRYLVVTNYLAIKLSITYNFTACREYLAENRLSFPSAPHWVRHSYLSKGIRLIPYTCGSSRLFSGTVAGEWSALGKWKSVRKKLILRDEIYCYLLLWKTILWGVCLG